ncbi:MAG: lysophospholipid acyltransferase family protein [Muribaculaceae bacterium]|nr:lysophospholipid acyltransferase family protein [Muribaculaceae bacterium]
MSEGKKAKGSVGTAVAAGCVKAVALLPFPVLYAISDVLYYIVYYVARYRRKVARRNLVSSFPEKNIDDIKRIERKFYRFFVDMVLESAKLMTMSREEMKRHMVFVNPEALTRFTDRGISVSAYLGHFGNWEWISSAALWAPESIEMAQIYHKLKSKAMDEVILHMRERMGQKCVEMRDTVRFMAHDSGRPRVIGFIADQSPKRHVAKYFIHFLNHEVPVLTGTEKATKHYGYQAVFIAVRRLRRGYYQAEFVPLADDPASLPDFELTDRYFAHLETEIREHPELYLWTHNRFKYAKTTDNGD